MSYTVIFDIVQRTINTCHSSLLNDPTQFTLDSRQIFTTLPDEKLIRFSMAADQLTIRDYLWPRRRSNHEAVSNLCYVGPFLSSLPSTWEAVRIPTGKKIDIRFQIIRSQQNSENGA